MAQWKAKNPERRLGGRGARRTHTIAARGRQQRRSSATRQGATYGEITQQRRADLEDGDASAAWSTGSTVFHSGDELGSTIAVSCDMCHPDAANTHPETYPKFQVQLGRVALLRDMINWCIEHPVRGSRSPPTTRACARSRPTSTPSAKGTPLDYGKR